MSYFHTGIRTIIGAEAFHCPVRDGKEWDHLAMVVRHNLQLAAMTATSKFIESIQRVESEMIAFLAKREFNRSLLDDLIIKVIGSSLTGN